MRQVLSAFWRDKDGQDMVEYALLLAFVVIGALGIIQMNTASISTIANKANDELTNAGQVAAGGS